MPVSGGFLFGDKEAVDLGLQPRIGSARLDWIVRAALVGDADC
jgi:hypothetical protein